MNALKVGILESNRVLKSAFVLLAIMLLPTIVGTWGGLECGFPADAAASPWFWFFITMGMSVVLLTCIYVFRESGMAVPFALMFSLLIGFTLSPLIFVALNIQHGVSYIAFAIGGTAMILIGCSMYAASTERDFSGLGGYLFGALLFLIFGSVLNLYLHLPWLHVALSAIAVLLFSMYLIFDIQEGVNGGERNYVLLALGIYLSVVNIFASLLDIAMSCGSEFADWDD